MVLDVLQSKEEGEEEEGAREEEWSLKQMCGAFILWIQGVERPLAQSSLESPSRGVKEQRGGL